MKDNKTSWRSKIFDERLSRYRELRNEPIFESLLKAGCTNMSRDEWIGEAEDYVEKTCPDTGLSYHFLTDLNDYGLMGKVMEMAVTPQWIRMKDISSWSSDSDSFKTLIMVMCRCHEFDKDFLPYRLLLCEAEFLERRLKGVKKVLYKHYPGKDWDKIIGETSQRNPVLECWL